MKVLGIASYEGMKDLMCNVVAKRNDVSLDVFVANLADAVDFVKNARGDYDIIMARGETSRMIAKITSVPVVEIEFSQYDMMRAISTARGYNGKFAIVGFTPFAKCARLVTSLLQYDAEIFTVNSLSEMESCIYDLRNRGYSLLLGSTVLTQLARGIGFNTLPIQTGQESIEAAFDKAETIYRAYESEKNLRRLLEGSLRAGDQLVVVMDGAGKTLYSSAAGVRAYQPVLERLAEGFAGGDSKFIEQIAGDYWSFRGKTFELLDTQYTAYYIHKIHYRVNFDRDSQGVEIFGSDFMAQSVFSEAFFENSRHTRSLVGQVSRLGRNVDLFLLTGEKGVEKDEFAGVIHAHGHAGNAPFIAIGGNALSEEKWRDLFDETSSIFNESNVTFCFRHANEIPLPIQRRLLAYFADIPRGTGNKYILCCDNGGMNGKAEPLIGELGDAKNCLHIHIPPLRERPDDIPNLVSLYVSELNMQMNTQVIGFTSEALKLLCGFTWHGNLIQLRQVLKGLVINAKGLYIAEEEVAAALAGETNKYLPTPAETLKLTGSLKDIMFDVINIVLKQEDMNQTKAAQRLGISRATLWKYVKTNKNQIEEK